MTLPAAQGGGTPAREERHTRLRAGDCSATKKGEFPEGSLKITIRVGDVSARKTIALLYLDGERDAPGGGANVFAPP